MVTCSKRKSVRYLWSAAIISTVVACSALVYISLLFGKYDQSKARSLREIYNTPEKLTGEKCYSVCDSQECVVQSKFLLSRLDPDADPCENVFDFLCGKHVEQFTEVDDESVAFSRTSDMKMALKNVLDNLHADPKSISGKMKMVYESCIKQSSSDSRIIPALLQHFADLGIPNWPNLAPDFKFTDPNLTVVLANFIKYKEYAFIDVSGFVFMKKPSSQVNATIRIAEGTYEKKEKSMRKYLVERTLQYFDLDTERINKIWEESEAVNDAITHLKETRPVEKVDKNEPDTYHLDCALDTDIAMKPVCEILAQFVDSADVSSGISRRFAKVRGESIYFMQNLFIVFSCFNDTSIVDYLAVNLLLKHLDDFNFYFRLLHHKDPDSHSIVPGIRKEIGHWQHCVEWVTKHLFLPLAYEYRKQKSSIFDEVEDLIRENIQETASTVSNQKWMNESSREQLREQIEQTMNSIELLKPDLTNETLLNIVFDQFHPTNASFLYNVFEYQRFSKQEETIGILQDAGLHWISSDILSVGASGSQSSLDIHMGILIPPVFRMGLQRLLNLISFAEVVVHEIGHGIQGANYRLRQSDAAYQEYVDKVDQCIANQYSQFRFEFLEKNMNGSKYIHENVADTIAMSVIDKLIERYTSENNVVLLPAFPYIPEQLLYISAFQFYCETSNKRKEEFNDRFDTHSFGKFRVMGMLQNSKKFAEAFSCSESSYMNPSTKCLFLE